LNAWFLASALKIADAYTCTALHVIVNKTFNTYRARLQKLANKVFFSYRIFSPNQIEIGLCIRI
jgi:hypothetical protein